MLPAPIVPGGDFLPWLQSVLEALGATCDGMLELIISHALAEETRSNGDDPKEPFFATISGLDEDVVLVHTTGGTGEPGLYGAHWPGGLTGDAAETYQRLRLDGVRIETAHDLALLLAGDPEATCA